MRYFVISSDGSNLAVVLHDYLRGTYVRRSTKESFCQVFDACSAKKTLKTLREPGTLRVSEFSAFDFDWIDTVLEDVLKCNPDWNISLTGDTSGSNLTIDDVVSKHLLS